MKRCFPIITTVILTIGGAVVAQHHGDHDNHKGHDHETKSEVEVIRDATIEGHVIDIVCYTRLSVRNT